MTQGPRIKAKTRAWKNEATNFQLANNESKIKHRSSKDRENDFNTL
jgi:hypothetical protein